MMVPAFHRRAESWGVHRAYKCWGVVVCRRVPLVDIRAKAMNDACEATPGSMAVILGLDADAVDAFVKALNMPQDLWVANYNCPGQIVISGTLRGIEAGVAAAKQAGAKRALPCRCMEPSIVASWHAQRSVGSTHPTAQLLQNRNVMST